MISFPRHCCAIFLCWIFHLVGQVTISQATRELEVAPRSNMRDRSPICRAGSFEKHMIDSTVIFGAERLHYSQKSKLIRTDAEAWTLEVERVAPSLKVHSLKCSWSCNDHKNIEYIIWILFKWGKLCDIIHVLSGDGEGWHERLEKSSWTDAHIQVI